MKLTTLAISAIFCHFSGSAQITQDSINKLQEGINKSQEGINELQAGINKRQKEVNALQMSLSKDVKMNDGSDGLIRNILDDLLALKIITDKEVVAFSLSTDKMEVNNNTQSDAVLDFFKSKYRIVKGYSMVYAKTKNSRSLSITK